MGKSAEAVHVHTNIGKPGLIVELDPYPDDPPSERDMSHLSDELAGDLYDQLGKYLGGDDV